jgi:alpha-2-macroglobulin
VIRCRRSILALMACIVAFVAGAPDGHSEPAATLAAVDLFAPEGQIKDIRQVSARFTTSMVALGDPRLPDPFAVDCLASGKGRWADTRNWVYDFDAAVPAGVRCTFTLRPALKAVDGESVSGRRTFEFTTGGPAIIASYPYDGWRAVDEEQIFLLKLDAPATPESVQAHAHCVVQGVDEEIPVEVLTGTARSAVLKERQALGYQYFRLLWKSGQTTNVRVRERSLERAEAEIAVVRCQRRLPPATKVVLNWGSGISTPSGVATNRNQKLAFRVRAAFTARVECTRANARAGCLPMLPIAVQFSAPVPVALVAGSQLKFATGKTQPPVANPAPPGGTVEEIHFAAPFPESSTVIIELPPTLVDDAGRTLENAARFPLEVRVDFFPPLAKFAGTFGILEAAEGGVLPVTLRNLEPDVKTRQAVLPAKLARISDDPATIASWLRRVEDAGVPRGESVQVPNDEMPTQGDGAMGTDEDESDEDAAEPGRPHFRWRDDTGTTSVFTATDTTTDFTIHKPLGSKPSEVIGIPLKGAGFYVVEVESRALGQSLLGRDQVRYVATSALVTNLAVHFAWGRESSVVWVTQLNDGAPVADADVAITDYCNGGTRWHGKTGADGRAPVSDSLGPPHENAGCNQWSPAPLLVTAQKGADLSFTQSGWGQGIGPQNFGLPLGGEGNSVIYHTVFDRALFRAGEIVSMKHYLRRHRVSGFVVLGGVPQKRKVTISHAGSGQKYELEAEFGPDGIATSEWKIPTEAKLGDYTVAIHDDELGRARPSGTFKVEQFRLPSMRASVTGPATPLVRPSSATVDLHVAYLSGGAATGIPVKLRTVVEPRPLQFAGYSDYQFGGAQVTEGIVTNSGGLYDLDFENDSTSTSAKAQVMPLMLDGQGSARVSIPDLPELDVPAVLTAELEYSDANGELLTSTGHIRLVPAAVSVGIRREGWVASSDQLRFKVVVLDLKGAAQAHQPVAVSLYQSKSYSYRKRLIGGFYTYETTRETRKLPVACQGTTDALGLLACEVAPGISGEVLVRAEAKDATGHPAGATTSLWVAGEDDWWFGGTSGDRMDLLPEKKAYEPGDTARFQVRMPFRAANALVTIERQGVLTSFVTRLDGKQPVIEIPITGDYAPNVFVSVLAVRGRIPHPDNSKIPAAEEVTALVDLNKPAYRLGIAGIQVGWKAHRLDVAVTADKPTYRVREKAPVRIHVTRADGSALPGGSEVAVAAVDEALLELAANPSWDLLKAMMGERGLEVFTSTAQTQVVGKRHYGRKAVPTGGGGGRERNRARELFDSLLLWQPRVRLDANGDALITVPLNDSLSEFRVVAIASGGAGLFGTGSAVLHTTQDLILLSGVPPVVREGDRYTATFTVRNTTDHALAADLKATLTPAGTASLDKRHVALAPGQSADVSWLVTAPVGARALQWDVSATDTTGTASDKIRVSELVIPVYPVRTYQATIAQLSGPFSVPVARPDGAIPGRGGLEVTLRTRLGDGLDGVREYMSRYSYTCLEQQLSRAIALRDQALWGALMERLPAYMDFDGLLKYFPAEQLEGDDTLTAYVLAIASEAGWTLNDADRERLVAALSGFVHGRIVRGSALPTADLAIRKIAAIDALSRYGAAEPAMLDSVSVEPNLWPTSAVIDWLGILGRVTGIPDAEAKRAAALQILRSRLNFQGTTMGFSTERRDALWWLMISGDSNANRMLLAVVDRPEWREDIPRLVRGALGRQQSGHWNTTVANAWGVLAMERFSAAFESVPVTGASYVRYGAERRPAAWMAEQNSHQVDLPWQNGPGRLDIDHSGTGKPWAIIRATAALPLDRPMWTGFKVKRIVTPLEQQHANRLTRGDVARVRLELEAQSDMSWVVVDDPVPAGATILGTGLGGQSQLLARDEHREGWVWPAFEERRFDGFRAYYRFVPKGVWTVEYTVRLNNPGTFLQPSTRIEAMYAPEMFGELPNATVTVEAKSP